MLSPDHEIVRDFCFTSVTDADGSVGINIIAIARRAVETDFFM
jgi:hypothetical protein